MEDSAPWFHVTFRSRVARIRREGLTLGRRRNWSNTFGSKLGQRNAIYLFDDFTRAVRWAHRMEYDFERPVDILVLDRPAAVERDMNAEAQMNQAWLTLSAIPPEMIRRVIPTSPELFRQVAQTQHAQLPE